MRGPGALLILTVVVGCSPSSPGANEAASAAPASPANTPATPAIPPRTTSDRVEIADLYHLRSASDVHLSPDGTRVVFAVQHTDRPRAPYSRIWLADVSSQRASAVAGDPEGTSPRWSPDGQRLAWLGSGPQGTSGVIVANPDGTNATLVAEVTGSNNPLPQVGRRLAWSPDGTRIAFVSAMPGPEPPMEADPIVITRYWFRPASSAGARFNDNRRLHLFEVTLATKQVRPLTEGTYDEHSIDWSPDGRSIVFLSNRGADPDLFFNYDLFALDVNSGQTTRLTDTKNNEYQPVWSPDGRRLAYQGLKRPITSSETNMEDTHVWLLDVAGGQRRELGAAVDNRQGPPQWSADGAFVYASVQSRGSVFMYRFATDGSRAEPIELARGDRLGLGSFSVGASGAMAYAMAAPSAPADLYLTRPGGHARLTDLNNEVLRNKRVGDVEPITFKSFDRRDVEAFLTKPLSIDQRDKHPMIVMIHGGPHGQQGPMFNHRAQVYAARGWAALMVNYRGSTGYGQAFSNAIARDQNGGEAKDILSAIDAVLSRHPWIDGNRLGVEGQSYGGQLSNWLVTQTDRFKAAVPAASISNLVSHNYMSVYHDYLEQEYGAKPHLGGIVDMLWERSAIRQVHRVKTPVMFIHGDDDQLVNPAEIEQFFIALKDVGVETVMVRYPREGHGMRESAHIADTIARSIAWYERHFAKAAVSRTNGAMP